MTGHRPRSARAGAPPTLPGTVGLVGLGVMGGSLAQALAARGVAVFGHTPDFAEGAAALEAGAVRDLRPTPASTARDVECWIVATPLAAFGGIFEAAAGAGPPLIMDLGSLQGPPLDRSAAAGLGLRHVSAHPMVGSERSGFDGARADLYDGAPVWLSAGDETTPGARRAAEAFWSALGAEPRWIDAEAHDVRMAVASHLPQLTATTLAAVMAERGVVPGDLGPGGRDTTRLAASSPIMWRDLLAESAPRVAPLMRALAAEAERWAERLESGDLDAVLRAIDSSRSWRSS